MDKQQFDHIENRIRQAAEGITTPVTEEAWEKMELLLDQEGKKDRGVFWWWYLLGFFLLFGTGLLFYFNKQHSTDKEKQTATSSQKESTTRTGQNTGTSNTVTRRKGTAPVAQPANPSAEVAKQEVPKAVKSGSQINSGAGNSGMRRKAVPGLSKPNRRSTAGETQNIKKQSAGTENLAARPSKHAITGGETVSTEPKQASKANRLNRTSAPTGSETGKNQGDKQFEPDRNTTTITNPDSRDEAAQQDTATQKLAAQGLKESPDKQDSTTQVNRKDKPRKLNVTKNTPGFYLIASVAPDATSVNKFTFDNYNAVFGLGVGYRLNKRISVQTGFYAGQKIYTAGPGDYKIKQGANISSILFIDADCYIYEIPLTLRYDVVAKRKYNVYATAGLSSYIFKKENYDFHFLNLSGAYRRMPYNYKNNTDLLSVVDLSVGFEHKLFKSFSIQGEPYVKFPLSGLGEGKVKLNSAGLLLGIKYQPLKKKTKK